jgi:hypothetical protein
MSAADLQSAQLYLSSVRLGPWQWDDDREAIIWENGSTITLRQELGIVLKPLATHGLPDLSTVLFLLAACREGWPRCAASLRTALAEITYDESRMPGWIDDVFEGLHAVHVCIRELSQTPQIKADLLKYLFPGDRPHFVTNAGTATEVCRLLAGPLPAEELNDIWLVDFDLAHTIGTLHGCLQNFDTAAFRRWQKTGVAQPLVAADVELTDGQRVRSLLKDLQDHDELGGVVRLARQLLAALTLPRPLAEPDDLPLGGVSDITNRGALDRLLLSELAHDDLTLAVRVATGEALYYRRETPPRSPPLRRTLVLDSGIRLWGVPRLFATAVGIALAAAGDEKLAINTFCACDDEVQPIDLTRQAGLEVQLARLETNLHLGDSLAFLKKMLAEEDVPSDVVLITSEDALADAEFRQKLRAAALTDVWIAAVNRDGRVRLFEAGQRELVLKREATFDLTSILAPTKKPTPVPVSGTSNLPAFCRARPCPLLIPHDLNPERSWSIGDQGVLAVYKDGRLTYWSDPKFGPQLLADDLPNGRVLWADSRSTTSPYRAVVGSLSASGLVALHVWPEELRYRVARLKYRYPEQVTAVTGTREHIYVISAKRVVAFAWTGEERAMMELPNGWRHIQARVFAQNGSQTLVVVHCDGQRIGLTAGYSLEFTAAHDPVSPSIIALAGTDERPVALTKDGRIFELLSRSVKTIKPYEQWRAARPRLQLAALARNGDRVAFRTDDNQTFVYHQSTGNVVPTYIDPAIAVEPKLEPFLRKMTLRHHFSGIHNTTSGHIGLVSKRGQALSLSYQGQLVLRDTGVSQVKEPWLRRFQEIETDTGYTLQKSAWDDGSEAWLDSRGLLHLRSSNPKLPEVSIVLREGSTAGWASTGEVFGNTYFTGLKGETFVPPIVAEVLRSFFGFVMIVHNISS